MIQWDKMILLSFFPNNSFIIDKHGSKELILFPNAVLKCTKIAKNVFWVRKLQTEFYFPSWYQNILIYNR